MRAGRQRTDEMGECRLRRGPRPLVPGASHEQHERDEREEEEPEQSKHEDERDHGCLLLGSTFNYLTQDMERDILIIKVDENGLWTGSHDIISTIVHDAILYPNPGNARLCVETGLKDAGFELYDVLGNNRMHQILNPGLTVISTQDLTTGMYFYRITQKDRVVESGTWVKGDW